MNHTTKIREEINKLPLHRHKQGDTAHIAKHTRGKHHSYWFLLCGYLEAWNEASNKEPLEHKKANAGRAAANSWIRKNTDI